jgi:hypothetical protein
MNHCVVLVELRVRARLISRPKNIRSGARGDAQDACLFVDGQPDGVAEFHGRAIHTDCTTIWAPQRFSEVVTNSGSGGGSSSLKQR